MSSAGTSFSNWSCSSSSTPSCRSSTSRFTYRTSPCSSRKSSPCSSSSRLSTKYVYFDRKSRHQAKPRPMFVERWVIHYSSLSAPLKWRLGWEKYIRSQSLKILCIWVFSFNVTLHIVTLTDLAKGFNFCTEFKSCQTLAWAPQMKLTRF